MSFILDKIEKAVDSRTAGPATLDTPLGGDVRFHSMGGIEGLSRPFTYEIDVVSDRSDIKPSELLGQPATVHLSLGDEEGDVRHWNGLVTALQYIDTSDDGDSRYRLVIRPWLWQLTRSADCRIFQQMSIPQIVTQVFQDRGFTDFELALSGDYAQRNYVVQYRETDFQFISRLLEREGIYYFFRHEDGKHHGGAGRLSAGSFAPATPAASSCRSRRTTRSTRDATLQYVQTWKSEAQLETGCSRKRTTTSRSRGCSSSRSRLRRTTRPPG